MRPLVPAGVAESFEESLDLEWPIDGLEPLSFVLARLFEPLCDRLERGDRGAVVLRVTLTLVTGPRHSLGEGGRDRHERVLELPAPMRDARVLRTLALLDLESNPPPAAIDRVAVGVDVAEGRVLQFGLFARALPTDTLATLLARLGALMGSDHVGAPSLVDTYRPGAFAMAKFDPPRTFTDPQSQSLIPRLNPKSRSSARPYCDASEVQFQRGSSSNKDARSESPPIAAAMPAGASNAARDRGGRQVTGGFHRRWTIDDDPGIVTSGMWRSVTERHIESLKRMRKALGLWTEWWTEQNWKIGRLEDWKNVVGLTNDECATN